RLSCFLARAIVISLGACSFRGAESIARLVATQGVVERDRPESINHWVAVSPGAELAIGDGGRTGVDAHATVLLSEKSVVALEAEALVGFLERTSSDSPQTIDVRDGLASIVVGKTPMELATRFGRAQIESHSHVRMDPREIRVSAGSALIDRGAEETRLAA